MTTVASITLFVIFLLFPLKTQAITVTEKAAVVFCQNDPSTSLEIPADTFKKPADVKLRKLSESEFGTPTVDWNMDRFSDIYQLEVFDENTKEPINYFRKELKLKIPVNNPESLNNLAIFFWDRQARIWIAADSEILDQDKTVIVGKVNYSGYYTVSQKTFDGKEFDYYKFAAIIFVATGLLITFVMWYNKKRKPQ